MISNIPKTLAFSVLVCFAICMTNVSANYVEFLEQLGLEEMFHVLGPKELLLTFSNNTNRKLISSEACMADIWSYKYGLDKKETWAIRMMDASSKIPPGLLIGNLIEMGMYDECMEVYLNKSGSEIRGNYCMYIIHLLYKNKTLPLNPLLSICLPVSCQENDLTNILHKRMEDTESYKTYNISEIEVYCSDVHVRDSTGVIITMTVIATIVLFLIICTILDWLQKNRIIDIEIPHALSEISLYKSAMDIFSMKDNPGSISALHGLRFLSTSIIILGHSVLLRAASQHVNNIDLAYLPVWQKMIMMVVYYSVDTFFTISGFLISYSFLQKHMSKNEKFSIGKYYLHRYIRLMPATAALLFISIYIFPFIGSGPKWSKITKTLTSNICNEKLWTVLLFVNNIVNKKGYCLPHLWSTSVDMQLFWISPLILYPLAKRPKLGLWILGILFFFSMLTPAIVLTVYQYPFSLNTEEVSFKLVLEGFENLYSQTHTRASSWLLGIFLGYFVITGSTEFGKSTIVAGWTLTAGAGLFCAVGFYPLVKRNYEYDVVYEAMFGALSRPIWSAGIAWIIFSSIRGFGGHVSKFLSLPIFYPLSRLSFCLYLVHVLVQVRIAQVARISSYFLLSQAIINFLSDLLLSFIAAFFLCILFEIPTRTLEKLIFRRTDGHQELKKEVKNKEDLNNPTELPNGRTNSSKDQVSSKKVL